MRDSRLKIRLLGIGLALAWVGLSTGCARLSAGARLIRPEYAATQPAGPAHVLTTTAYFQPRTAPPLFEALADAE